MKQFTLQYAGATTPSTYAYGVVDVQSVSSAKDTDAVLLLEVGGKHIDADGDTWERVPDLVY